MEKEWNPEFTLGEVPEETLPEDFDLDGFLQNLDGMLTGGDTAAPEELREKMQAGDTMQFTLPGEAPVKEKPRKPEKRRGKKAKAKKKSKKTAREERLENEATVRGDTVRLDTGLIAAKAAEMEGETVRFSVPAWQAEDEEAEEPTLRLYPSGAKGEITLIQEDEELLSPEDLERIVQDAQTIEAEEEAAQSQAPALKVLEKREKRERQATMRSADKQYDQAAIGLGGAQTRLFFGAIFAGVSLLLTALSAFEVLSFKGGASFLPFLQMVLLLLCALMTYDMVAEGLLRLLRLKPDLHSVLFVALVFSIIDGGQCILTGRSPFTSLVCLGLATSLWANCQNRSRICDTMEVIRRGGPVDAALREPALWEGKDGVLRGSGNMEEFLLAQEQTPRAQRIVNIYSLAALAVSAVVSGLTCGGSFLTFARCFTGMLLASMPALAFVAVSRPWAAAAHRLKYHGAALSGWEGARNTRGSLAVPFADQDLFPEDMVRMNGIKLYPDVEPDKTIAYGAAAICASGSGLSGIFTELVERRNLRKCQVSNLRRYDNGGISAEIGQDSVLAGSLPFMQAMGVEMPKGTQVSQAVYVAVNGFLGGVFAVNYAVTKASAGGLATLVHSGGVTPVLMAQDFVITPEFLQTRFKVNTSRILFPTPRERAALAARKPSEQAKQCAVLTKPEFSSLAKAVACGRALYTAARWSTLINVVSGIIGLAITGVLAWIGALDTLTAGNLMLYVLVWSVPVWILGSIVRSA